MHQQATVIRQRHGCLAVANTEMHNQPRAIRERSQHRFHGRIGDSRFGRVFRKTDHRSDGESRYGQQ